MTLYVQAASLRPPRAG